MAQYMISVRKLKKKASTRHFCDEVGPGQFLRCKQNSCGVDDIIPRKDWMQALSDDVAVKAGDGLQQIIFYVHPYRATVSEALEHQQAFQQVLATQGFKGLWV